MSKLKLPLSPEHLLVRWANGVRGFYGYPVYLVGSQLTDKLNPRDVDVICFLPKEIFELRYGNYDEWCSEGCTGLWTNIRWVWSDDCVKRSYEGMRYTDLLIDFKVYSDNEEKGFPIENFPKLKLDTRGL
jgi:hypothetical protein